MQTKKYNNGQRSPPPVPKTGSNLQGTIKAVLGCQMTNGINPRSAIRPQQLYMFQTVCLSIIRSLFAVHSAMVHVIQLSGRTRMELQ